MSVDPVFSRVTTEQRRDYDLFFEYTASSNIESYGSGWNLSNLASLAEKTIYVITHANPIWDYFGTTSTDQQTARHARQWELDRISEVKQRLASAIPYKKSYYENNWMGAITRFFLQLFGKWNNGDTASIISAENVLLRYDTRATLRTLDDRKYAVCWMFPFIPTSWVLENLDTSRFYNYTPTRTIEIEERLGFRTEPERLPPTWIVCRA